MYDVLEVSRTGWKFILSCEHRESEMRNFVARSVSEGDKARDSLANATGYKRN
jgi:hypothetical protein